MNLVQRAKCSPRFALSIEHAPTSSTPTTFEQFRVGDNRINFPSGDNRQVYANSITLPSLQKFVTVLHGKFYSALSTPIEQRELVVNYVR